MLFSPMNLLTQVQNYPRQQKTAIILALLTVLVPLPIAGIHKFYLGQYGWGIIYLLLWSTPIPRIACAIDAVWYILQDSQSFQIHYNSGGLESISVDRMEVEHIEALTLALEKLEQLRQQGLVSELEFEQKRRQLLDRI